MIDRYGRYICMPGTPDEKPGLRPSVHPYANFLSVNPEGAGREYVLYECMICRLRFRVYLYEDDIPFHDVLDADHVPVVSNQIDPDRFPL